MAICVGLDVPDGDEAIEDDPGPPFLFSTVGHSQEDGRTQIFSSTITLVSPDERQCWNWTVDPTSFEVVEGLLRLSRAIPVQLAQSLLVNELRLPGWDGTFFIRLVLSLIAGYHGRILDVNPPLRQNPETVNFIFGREDLPVPQVRTVPLSLYGVTTLLRTRMHAFKQHLPDCSPDLIDEAKVILKLCDDIQKMCHCYLLFIHPLWRSVNSTGDLNDDITEPLRSSVIQTLNSVRDDAFSTFSALMP